MADVRPLSRHVRAAVFAAVCVTLAAAGHAAMSGGDVPFPALLAAFAVTAAAAWLAAGRRRGVLSIGTGLLAVQAALHLIFSGEWLGTPGHAADHPPVPTGAAAVPDSAAPHGEAGAAALHADAAATAAHTAHTSWTMLGAHLLAAVCCALWLWRGEAAFFRLLRCLGALARPPLGLLLAVSAAPPVVRRPVPPRPRVAAGPPRSVLFTRVLSRRGPPRGAVPPSATPTPTRRPAPGI